MILETLYFAALAIIGLGVFGKSVDKTGALLVAGISIPAGIGFMSLVQLLLAVGGVKLNGLFFWALVVGLTVAATGRLVVARPERKTLAVIGVVIAVAIVGTAVFQTVFHAAVLSFDSYDYLVLSSNLYRPDTELSSRAMSGFLNNYPPLLWIAHGPARFFGSDFLTLLHPLVFASTMIVSAGLVLFGLRTASISRWAKWGAAIVPSFVMMTTPQILHHAVYLMPNLLTGLLLTSAVSLLWVSSERDGSIAVLLPAAICLAGVALARQEGGLMAAVAMVAFSTKDSVPWRARTAFCASVAAIVTAWYATMIAMTGEASSEAILTPMNAALQFGCLWIAVAASASSRWTPLRQLVSIGAASMPVVLILAHLPFLIFGPAHAIQSMGTFAINMFWGGSLWGVWWVATLPLLTLTLIGPSRIHGSGMIALITLTIFILIDFLGVLRPAPYRLGDQDSGNRMLIHIFPLVWAYLAMRIVSELTPEKLPKGVVSA